ncbi:cyclic GMP-AMP synthase-like isoform X4 [Haliotis rubra]|uniref:cyclic GMP-AMP synthase-like isoform X4 n=1 Tax=Haliotis rubra TaxID=36100 RepID=UPI001EE61509|nr:cyclic GMP-AMP synthase-like isoform X4 [Haliotis rubra]
MLFFEEYRVEQNTDAEIPKIHWKEAAPSTSHPGKSTMHGLQRSVKSKSAAKSVSGAEGQMCGPSSKPSVTKIPQVSYPPRSKDDKHGLSPSKDKKQSAITASSAFRKEERSKPSSKQGVSKRDDTNTRTRLLSDTVKFPKVKYLPPPQQGKLEQSSVKDTTHPPIPGPSVWTKNRDSRGISKLEPPNTSRLTDDTTPLKNQEKDRRDCPAKMISSAHKPAGPLSTVGVKQGSGKAARDSDKTKLGHLQCEHNDNVVDTSEMDALITEMVNKQIIRSSGNPKRDIKNFFEKEVKMEKKDIDVTLGHFRRLKEKVIGLLNSEMNFGTWTSCNAGSHFDGTKVARPNEFDCTIFPVLQTKIVAEFDDTCKAGSCKVKVVGDVHDHEKDLQLFLEGSYVNSKRFKAYVFEKLERVLETDRKLKDARKFSFTQSFAVSYEGIPTEEGMKSIDIDFLPSLNIKPWPPKNICRDIKKVIPDQTKATAVQRKGFNVTAKHWCHAKNPDLLWQVSCSYAEKTITKYADKVSWKPSLRTLKRVLEIAKGNSDSCAKSNSPELLQIQKAVRYVQKQRPELRSSLLTTYHIRTLMWWQLYELTLGEHVWGTETMATRFQECLRKFQKMMTGEMVVPHFFLPQIKNILPHKLGKEREFLYVIARATEVIFSKKQ